MTVRVHGQTTFATITGNVSDQSGAAIVGSLVEATHVQSNYRYSATANEAGYYTIPQLREGDYIVRARSDGFKEFVARVSLAARDLRRLDIRLELGTVETVVEVSAGATLIETETARISDSKDANMLKSLPLNTRSLWNFMAMSPNVVPGAGATRRFAGSRANQSDAAIDGITISNNQDGTQISPLVSYIESFQEVRIDMANNTAEFGTIGMVTIISKGGSNEVHGNAFDYYQTPFFRARNPFALERSTGIQHQPGASIGGPVVLPKLYNGKDRTFFFYSFETSRGSALQNLLNPTVPLATWRQGDFGGVTTPVRDPMAGNAPFAGNRIPASRLNAVSLKIQDRFYPLPNFGDPNVFQAQNYREMRVRGFDPDTYWTSRIDHRFSEKAFVFGRVTWNRSHSRGFEGNLPTIGQRWQQRDTRAVNLSYTHSLKPTLINEFRWGFAYNDNPRHGPLMGRQIVQDLGLVGLVDDLPDIPGVFRLTFNQIALTGIDQQVWRRPGFKNFAQQFQEHLSWFHGKHTIKAGGMLNRTLFADMIASNNLFGHANFSNRFTGHPYADFLLGIPTGVNRAFPPVLVERVRWATNLFITDEYKVRPNLTLNLGLRYEVMPGWNETSGRQAMFDIGSGAIVVPDGSLNLVSPLLPRGYVDLVEARQAGLPGSTLLRTDRNNLAPRIGMAWRPFGNDTVFRAGYGIFYDAVPRNVAAGGSPFVLNEPLFTNAVNAPEVIFPRVFPTTAGGLSSVGLPAAFRPDLRIPYSMQYNATVEHQRWSTGFRLSYIGTNTRQGEWSYNINQPVGDDRLFVDKPRMFPRYPAISYFTNGAGHQYHAMAIEVERRFARGLAWQWTYTLARDIGDLERGESPEDAYNRQRERAVWENIPTHRMTGNLIYQLPVGKGKRFLSNAGRVVNGILGGWEVSTIYLLQSGQFLTPLWTGPDPTGTAFTSNRTAPNVTRRPDHFFDANLPAGQRSVTGWFNPAAFGAPANLWGSAAKGVIKGPGSNVWHAGLVKYFDLNERMKLRWEYIATNAMNHPNWANPNTNITTQALVGVIQGVGGVAGLDQAGPRTGRMSLRLEW
ncbi:MAG: carboxypeptidase-like regulatory domain-containing protein [Bryobacteraceae bacterium]